MSKALEDQIKKTEIYKSAKINDALYGRNEKKVSMNDLIEKGTKHSTHKYLRIENGKYIYDDSKMTSKDHKEAVEMHKTKLTEAYNYPSDRSVLNESYKNGLISHQKEIIDHHEKPAKEKDGGDIKYLPYSGGTGPTEKQAQNNNKYLGSLLDKEKIPYKMNKEFMKELSDEDDSEVLEIKHPKNKTKIYTNYDRYGFVTSGDSFEENDQETPEETIKQIKKWYSNK